MSATRSNPPAGGRAARHGTRARTAIFAPLEEVGRAVRVEQRLADAIRTGVLRDGERLPSESELAGMFGVATVTAREALVGLRGQGLISTVRGRNGGSYVTRPTGRGDETLLQRLAAMSRVELHDRGVVHRVVLAGCAELAAQSADPHEIADLEELVPAPDLTDAGHWRHADAEIYLSLAALTQSARMTREVVRLEADFGALLRLPLSEPGFQELARAHYADLVAALRDHDGTAARSAVGSHLGRVVDELAVRHAAAR